MYYKTCKHKLESTLFVRRAKGNLAKIQDNRVMHIEVFAIRQNIP